MPLSYLPKSLLDDVSSWDFTNTVKSAVSGLQDSASELMKPVTEQVGSVVRSALPAPAPAPPPEPPAVPRFSVGRPEDWITPTDPQRTGNAAVSPGSGQFILPSPESFMVEPQQQPAASPVVMGPPSAQGAAAPAAISPSGPAPQRGGDLHAYARAAASAAGVDPDIFERQINQESKFDPTAVSPAGARGIAQFMPATAAGVGLTDPMEPYSALDAAAKHMRSNLDANQGRYDLALAAYNAGQGNVNKHGGVPPFAETQQYVANILGADRPTAQSRPAPQPASQPAPAATSRAAVPPHGTYTAETLVPNQVSEGMAQGLTAKEAVAICGPAAAVAFARANGRNPTVREAKELAEATGVWDVGAGMHGPASEVALLDKMGVSADLAEGADWGRVASEVQQGRPVIVDTPQHYYVATGYDPRTGEFEFGQSASVLSKSGGKTRWRPDELPSLGMGGPRATIFQRSRGSG